MENHESIIGVGMLELALGKLYTDPSVIYREYIQNACDGLELALRQNLITKDEAFISITIDKHEISIKDRGVGVRAEEIGKKLVDIGNSEKYKDNLIGQYGIGRLIAAKYCDKIIFETSAVGENVKSILTWDTKKAFEMIDSHLYAQATDVVDEVTKVEHFPEDEKEHYFRVKLDGVNNNIEKLTDVESVKEYVSMMAPVDYTMEFKEAYLHPAFEKNPEYEELYKKQRIYKVTVNNAPIRKAYSVTLLKDLSLTTPLFMRFEDYDHGLLAWGWYALNNKIVQMNNSEFRGIRFRKLNMAVGDANVMANYMKNVSVNYFVGEIFFTNDEIQPTGSRDGFVDSQEKREFDVLMKEKAEKLYQLYDRASHLGSQAIDKMTAAYIKKTELKAQLSTEEDAAEKKIIKEQIKEQENIIENKAVDYQNRITELQQTKEGTLVAETLLATRQKMFDQKIQVNNAKPSKPKIKQASITQIVEKADTSKSKLEEDSTDETTILKSRLKKEAKSIFKIICDVIDNESALTPSYKESIKKKILKKIAK